MLRRCDSCGEHRRLTYHPLTRQDLCPRCLTKAPRHPDLRGPLSGAAVSHIARCPTCYLKVHGPRAGRHDGHAKR
jgi:hypothetical protein